MKPIRAFRYHHYLVPIVDSNSKELYANIDFTAFTSLTLIHLLSQKVEINLLQPLISYAVSCICHSIPILAHILHRKCNDRPKE